LHHVEDKPGRLDAVDMPAEHVARPAIGAARRIDADMDQAKLGQLTQVAIATGLFQLLAAQLGAYIHGPRLTGL
jgi:hypothetical protein